MPYSSVITQPLFWEDGKEIRKYGLHRATIDVVPTHSYPTDSYMSRFTKSLRGGGWLQRVPPIRIPANCSFHLRTFLSSFGMTEKDNRKYGLHRTIIDVELTHRYPADSYINNYVLRILGACVLRPRLVLS